MAFYKQSKCAGNYHRNKRRNATRAMAAYHTCMNMPRCLKAQRERTRGCLRTYRRAAMIMAGKTKQIFTSFTTTTTRVNLHGARPRVTRRKTRTRSNMPNFNEVGRCFTNALKTLKRCSDRVRKAALNRFMKMRVPSMAQLNAKRAKMMAAARR